MSIRNNLTILLVICASILVVIESQIAFTELSKIGVIKAKNYKWKIKGNPMIQPMVIKLLPNMGNLTRCTSSAVDDYQKLLNRILTPISESLAIMNAAVQKKKTQYKFWGAVVGGVALGVATSAQITAGVALHNSLQNAESINQLKDAIKNSNNAITELKTASQQTVIALSALQDQINTVMIPTMNQMGCQIATNSLALKLSQYFSEISLVFGPNLRDPASETISIQALSRAFNGDFESILMKLGYTNSDFLDVLESNSIQARIIGVDTLNYLLILQIEYPVITEIPNAAIQKFNLISFNNKGSEWFPVFPKELLVRFEYISNIDLTGCTQTQNSYICSQDTSSPISLTLYDCISGDLSKCIATKNVNSQVSRYALSDGVLFANCMPITCECHSTQQTIIQDKKTSNVMITSEYCKEVYIDSFFITVGTRYLNRSTFSQDFTIGDQISIDPIDIGSDISQIQNSINRTQEYLDKSNEILNSMNPSVINLSSFTWIWVLIVINILWLIISLTWLIMLTKRPQYSQIQYSRNSRSPTISTLSSYVGN
ncbi:fusion protein [Wufeng Rhinolophus pearsonii paramyxovirus 1]|uniref:Fusion glycoprotein F0 n=1 Tax=Wufeng Rhinolophus pearsonii paramyxovirus 1 TaxID=2877502 RepID=A0AAE8XRY8_9MONO|nr:fusion protein [Wufeng Rhinolophus pearsonii paramyxovirus 1]